TVFAAGSLAAALLIYRNRKRLALAEAGLLRHRAELEETVRERTSQLEIKNEQLAGEIALRKLADADLQKTAIIMDRMADAVDWISHDGRFLYVNDAACRMRGYDRKELLAMSVWDVAPHFPAEVWPTHWTELRRMGHLFFETVNSSRDGREFPVEVSANYLEINGVEYNCAIIRDISDRRSAEVEKQHLTAQLHQSQKIESIGRLAGGIAHDFNNLLTPILVYAEMVKNHLAPGSRDFDRVANIMHAADKARVLTQQLLSFGRKQLLEIKTVDLNGVISSFHDILRRTIRENIAIQVHLSEEAYGIRADKNQLEQVIMNLAINAQDAIDDNGVITIETAPVILDDEYARHHAEVTAGAYLMLAVADTGCGMDRKTQAQIFEPFFTTKEVGKGSGLGLATVYGLVRQQGGHIVVESEVGQGTVFKIYFPIVEGMPDAEIATVQELREVDACDCTILLVEDNDMVREMVCDLLDDCGCQVLVANGARQALRLSEGKPVDLLLTDVVMPDMNGPELHRRLLESHCDLKVLYMSGYTDNAAVLPGVLDEGSNFIRKPFSLKDLARMIDAILELPAKS
ncbi:MAG: ATP-binding protein, partial [Oryzomonas sp.]